MGEREEPVFLLILLATAWVTLNNSFFFPFTRVQWYCQRTGCKSSLRNPSSFRILCDLNEALKVKPNGQGGFLVPETG